MNNDEEWIRGGNERNGWEANEYPMKLKECESGISNMRLTRENETSYYICEFPHSSPSTISLVRIEPKARYFTFRAQAMLIDLVK